MFDPPVRVMLCTLRLLCTTLPMSLLINDLMPPFWLTQTSVHFLHVTEYHLTPSMADLEDGLPCFWKPLCLLFFSSSSNWLSFQVRGISLSRALYCWDRSLEATRNNRTPARGCPFHLLDTCLWPQCNPTCPALVDQRTQQELTLLQMLVAMGLDLQKVGLDPRADTHFLASIDSTGS